MKATPNPMTIPAQWREWAEPLADWLMARVVVRRDVYGDYSGDGRHLHVRRNQEVVRGQHLHHLVDQHGLQLRGRSPVAVHSLAHDEEPCPAQSCVVKGRRDHGGRVRAALQLRFSAWRYMRSHRASAAW